MSQCKILEADVDAQRSIWKRGSLPPFVAFAQQNTGRCPERPLFSRCSFDLALAAMGYSPRDRSNGHDRFGAACRHRVPGSSHDLTADLPPHRRKTALSPTCDFSFFAARARSMKIAAVIRSSTLRGGRDSRHSFMAQRSIGPLPVATSPLCATSHVYSMTTAPVTSLATWPSGWKSKT